jgi:hypothetical protein
MQLRIKVAFFFVLLCNDLFAQVQEYNLYRFNQYGSYELLVGGKLDGKDKLKVRCLIVYSNSDENTRITDSLLDLQGPRSVMNKDSFVIHVVQLINTLKNDSGGYCPSPSKLRFYSKEIQHSSYAGGVRIYIDPESPYWTDYKGKFKSRDIGPAPGQPQLLAFKNNLKFFDMVIKKPYTPERLHSKISQLEDTIWEQRQQIGRLNYEIEELKRLDGGIALELAWLGGSADPGTLASAFSVRPLFMQKMGLFLKRKQPGSLARDWSVTSSLSVGTSLFFGQIEQNGATYIENLGWEFRAGEPYERLVYAKGIEERMEFRSINAGLGIGLMREWERWQLDFAATVTIQKVTMARSSLQSGLFSFGGRFPNINPEDTVFSGTGDFYTNVPVKTENVNMPVDRLFFDYSLGITGTYWFSDEKNLGACFGFNYLSLGMPFKNANNGLFATSDIASYQSLWSRFGNQQFDGIQTRLGLIFKLR